MQFFSFILWNRTRGTHFVENLTAHLVKRNLTVSVEKIKTYSQNTDGNVTYETPFIISNRNRVGRYTIKDRSRHLATLRHIYSVYNPAQLVTDLADILSQIITHTAMKTS